LVNCPHTLSVHLSIRFGSTQHFFFFYFLFFMFSTSWFVNPALFFLFLRLKRLVIWDIFRRCVPKDRSVFPYKPPVFTSLVLRRKNQQFLFSPSFLSFSHASLSPLIFSREYTTWRRAFPPSPPGSKLLRVVHQTCFHLSWIRSYHGVTL